MQKKLLFIFILIIIPGILTARISDTNQNTCYNSNYLTQCQSPNEDFYGQDAHYITNSQSFTKLDVHGKELDHDAEQWLMVRDNVTGLIWEIKQNSDKIEDFSNPHDADNEYSWYDSEADSEDEKGFINDNNNTEFFINSLNESRFGGFNDWRMPDLKELLSIVDLSIHDPSINTTYFNNAKSSSYWTSNTYTNLESNAWLLRFDHGSTYYKHKSNIYNVRAVRNSIIRSNDPPVNNNDGTTTDINTGLMWHQQSDNTELSWASALSYCENIEYSGYNDWRLPNTSELFSIADHNKYSPAIHNDYFSNTNSSYYWTSSTYIFYPDFGWSINLRNGSLQSRNKERKYFVQCVRGLQNMYSSNFFIKIPVDSSKWYLGEEMPITWESNGISGNVKILISRQGAKDNTFEVITDNTENDGQYLWKTTGPHSNNCMLKIVSLNDPAKSTMQGIFSIISNMPPIISNIDDQITYEDQELIVAFSVNDKETDPCDLFLITALDDYILVPDENIISDGNCSDRTITIKPASFGYGELNITLTVYDQAGLKNAESFKLKILPVNNCPDFRLKNKKIEFVIENQNYEDVLLTDIVSGPPNEIEQELKLTIETTNTNLFEVEPDISLETGILKFKSKPYITGESEVKLTMKDNGGTENNGCDTKEESITISLKPCMVSITTTDLQAYPTPVIEEEYKRTINTKCGSAPYKFVVSKGELPPNLSLLPETGLIGGYLMEAGDYYFQIKVIDSKEGIDTQNFMIEIVNKFKFNSELRLKSAIYNEPYPEEFGIKVKGGKMPYTFELCDNSLPLPPGMDISYTNGTFQGAPSEFGTYSFNICAASISGHTITNQFVMNVVKPLTITTARLNDGILNEDYKMKLEASGGYDRYNWNAEMPAGMKLDSVTGMISGEPQNKGINTILFSVEDTDGYISYKYLTLRIQPEIELMDLFLPSGVKNEDYNEKIAITGGFRPYNFILTNLPDGLSWEQETGIISGIPTEDCEQTVLIQIEDSRFPNNISSISERLNIIISENLTIITPGDLPPMEHGKQIAPIKLQARGGYEPYIWSIDFDDNLNSIPPGIKLNNKNEIAGIPEFANDYYFKIQVKDSHSNTCQKDFYWKIYKKLNITTSILNEAMKDRPYLKIMEAEGGYGTYKWSYLGYLGKLSIDEITGTIKGTPESVQPAHFVTIKVTDEIGNIATKPFLFEVLNKEIEILTTEIYDGYENRNYIANIYASGGKPEYSWKNLNDLPDGLELISDEPTTARIEGVPQKAGNYDIKIQVSDKSTPQLHKTIEYKLEIHIIDGLNIINQYLKEAIIQNESQVDNESPDSSFIYFDEIIVEGGKKPYHYDIIMGKLPDGLILNSETGAISGSVTKNGETSYVKIKAVDSSNPQLSDDKLFQVRVISPFILETNEIDTAMQLKEYSYSLIAKGGVYPYQWTYNGRLPSGIYINHITGLLSGTPKECGNFPFTIKVQDSARNRKYKTFTFDDFNVICDNTKNDIYMYQDDIIYLLKALTGFDEFNKTNLKIISIDKVKLEDILYILNKIQDNR